jgi:hypothetical protein
MAKVKTQDGSYLKKSKSKGVASKTKTSTSKTSKNYVKAYKGQGK